jgi:hypothetical protein
MNEYDRPRHNHPSSGGYHESYDGGDDIDDNDNTNINNKNNTNIDNSNMMLNSAFDDDEGGPLFAHHQFLGGDETGVTIPDIDFEDPQIASLPRVLLMGPRRGGKSSILVRTLFLYYRWKIILKRWDCYSRPFFELTF